MTYTKTTGDVRLKFKNPLITFNLLLGLASSPFTAQAQVPPPWSTSQLWRCDWR